MSVRVNKSRCPQNHPCPSIKACPMQALSQHGNAAPMVDPDKCTECGVCMQFCPMGALSQQ
jgi:Fe-S-cluster-containing hydrogenase component 2